MFRLLLCIDCDVLGYHLLTLCEVVSTRAFGRRSVSVLVMPRCVGCFFFVNDGVGAGPTKSEIMDRYK